MKGLLPCVLAPMLVLPFSVLADDSEWYGSIDAAYVFAGGEAAFFGNTASVYGGTPVVDMDEGGRFALAIGFAMPRGFRLEGEFAYLSLDTESAAVFGSGDRADDSFRLDGDVDSLVFMLNGAYDFESSSAWISPYLTAGIGVARNDARAGLDVDFESSIWDGTPFEGSSLTGYEYPEGTTTEFAWSIGAGLRFAFARRLSLSLEYGLIDLGETVTETDENGDAVGYTDLGSQQLSLGLDFRFR